MSQPLALHPPDPHIQVRPVTEDDLPHLRQHLWRERAATLTDLILKHILQRIASGRGLGLVAQAATPERQIIAYGQIMDWQRCAEISDLLVEAAYRGQGIGTALIQHLVQTARRNRRECVEIGVAVENVRALKLYERMGFKHAYRQRPAAPGMGETLYLRLSLT